MPKASDDGYKEMQAVGLPVKEHSVQCHDHLDAFNLGRCVGRMERDPDDFWLRLRWLLFGAGIGAGFAAVYVGAVANSQIMRLLGAL